MRRRKPMKPLRTLLGPVPGTVAFGPLAARPGAFPLSPPTGHDQGHVQPGTAPLINTLTVNQLATFVNQGDSTPRNVLLGGDFGSNPFQRGTSQAANISSTNTYGPDGFWFQGGASSAIQWSQQTGASDITTGFSASLRFQRASGNSDTAAICRGQVLESKNSVRLQGQVGVYSFWALSGANFSAASANVNVTVAIGTGTDQSAASFQAATWTGYSSLTLTPNQGTVTAAAGIAQPVTTTWTRYSFSFAAPATTTQIGIKICFTPVGTAGANDWVETLGEQLELSPGGLPSPFDYHQAATELNVSQRTFIAINEPAAGVGIGMGLSDTTTTCIVTVAFPDTMRAAPTVTFAGTALASTTWRVRIAGTNLSPSTPFLAAGTHTATNMNLTATTAASQTAGQACMLQGQGGGSKIFISAEL